MLHRVGLPYIGVTLVPSFVKMSRQVLKLKSDTQTRRQGDELHGLFSFHENAVCHWMDSCHRTRRLLPGRYC